LSNNFLDDLEFTTQYPINPALLKTFHRNPYDEIEHLEMKKYVNSNILDLLMIDNLLQSAKIDNSHYILHEDFRPYDKSSKEMKNNLNIYDETNDDSDKWGENNHESERKMKFVPNSLSLSQTAPSKKTFEESKKLHFDKYSLIELKMYRCIKKFY
jgi:hypothetical protein